MIRMTDTEVSVSWRRTLSVGSPTACAAKSCCGDSTYGHEAKRLSTTVQYCFCRGMARKCRYFWRFTGAKRGKSVYCAQPSSHTSLTGAKREQLMLPS